LLKLHTKVDEHLLEIFKVIIKKDSWLMTYFFRTQRTKQVIEFHFDQSIFSEIVFDNITPAVVVLRQRTCQLSNKS